MIATPRLRRWLAVLATAAVVGLGTFGLHHLYADGLGHDAAHDCFTCRVVASSNALTSAKPAAITSVPVLSAPVLASAEIERAGVTSIHGCRAPPFLPLA